MMKIFRDFDILPRFDRAVATVGSFDGVHRGHQLVLEKLRAQVRGAGMGVNAGAGASISMGAIAPHPTESVVITFLPHPRDVLGGALHLSGFPASRMPLLTTPSEKEMLLERAGVDNLVVMPFTRELAGRSATEFMALLARMGIVRLVAGFNQRFGHDRVPASEFAAGLRATDDFTIDVSEKLPEVNVSSTMIRRLIAEGNLPAAAQLLGYDYFVLGQWVGDEFIPSAPCKLLPPDGRYATDEDAVTIRGGRIFATQEHTTSAHPHKLSF